MSNAITVFSGDLFHISAQYLGDATQWIRIAQLNNLSDPVIRRLTKLVLPPPDSTAGGGIVFQS